MHGCCQPGRVEFRGRLSVLHIQHYFGQLITSQIQSAIGPASASEIDFYSKLPAGNPWTAHAPGYRGWLATKLKHKCINFSVNFGPQDTLSKMKIWSCQRWTVVALTQIPECIIHKDLAVRKTMDSSDAYGVLAKNGARSQHISNSTRHERPHKVR